MNFDWEKKVYQNNFPPAISTSNHMFRRALWNKLSGYIFENCPDQTRGYWLITQNQQTLCIEINIF